MKLGTSSGTILQIIPGLYVGCYNIDGMFQSTLEFLFDQNEIDLALQLLFNTTILNGMYPALDQTALQRFTVNTSCSELTSYLFVEAWPNITSHENYFISCQPVECQYSFVSKNGLIVTITFVLGIIGGLNTILRILTPCIISVILWVKEIFIRSNVDSNTTENGEFIYKNSVLWLLSIDDFRNQTSSSNSNSQSIDHNQRFHISLQYISVTWSRRA
jgi:hypothetical protein